MSFNSNAYTTEILSGNGVTITFRAYRNIPYCKKPKAPHLQVLNIFIPQVYIDGGEINGYTARTVPIFFPNAIGGYSEAYPCDVQVREDGTFNTEAEALLHGYVVISAGARGRQTEMGGRFVGKAPAFIVDMKAAIRYIRSISDNICGDVNKIISNGTSAGGATSALIGTSGDVPEYLPYLEGIGAEMTSDRIFASSCYCPITNLENADSAYEWQYGHLSERFWWDGHVKCTAEQMEYSAGLKPQFPEYLNSIKPNGMGIEAFTEFLKSKIIESAKTADFIPPESGIDLKKGTVDFEKYSTYVTRMKPPGAFDNPEMSTIENELFGTESESKRHFTDFAFENDNVGGSLAEKETVYLVNALNFVENEGCVKHWRIRHGASDRDTSFAISAILAQKLMENGKNVDYFLPWGIPHSGDYDLSELFEWIDGICK